MNRNPSDRDVVVPETDVRAFFRESVEGALGNQKVEASAHTTFYLVNLLSQFSHSNELFEQTSSGSDRRPLALLYGDALSAMNQHERERALKRLGDVALYVAGFFAASLSRSLVDVDYYVAMGGGAYGSLSAHVRGTRAEAFREIFDELSNKFVSFVDVLGEVSERTQVTTTKDILRLYEIWMKTGSKRAQEKLQEHGITPTEDVVSNFLQ